MNQDLTFSIRQSGNPQPKAATQRPATPGKWYAGINASGEIGMTAKWDGHFFVNSASDDQNEHMARYSHLAEQL